jgi:beta-phosphoglucomutase-like phosphatase (HAD superfamily)
LRRLSSPEAVTGFIRDRGPFEVCLWDFDGVVCDSEPFQSAAYREVLLRRGVRPSARFFEGFVGRTELEIWNQLMRTYGINVATGDLVRERRDVLRPRLIRDARPNWFVRPALRALAALGSRSVIVSSGDVAVIRPYLAAWSLASAFEPMSPRGRSPSPKRMRLIELAALSTGGVLLFEDVADYLTLGSSIGAVVIAVSHALNRSTVLSGDAIVEAGPEDDA